MVLAVQRLLPAPQAYGEPYPPEHRATVAFASAHPHQRRSAAVVLEQGEEPPSERAQRAAGTGAWMPGSREVRPIVRDDAARGDAQDQAERHARSAAPQATALTVLAQESVQDYQGVYNPPFGAASESYRRAQSMGREDRSGLDIRV